VGPLPALGVTSPTPRSAPFKGSVRLLVVLALALLLEQIAKPQAA